MFTSVSFDARRPDSEFAISIRSLFGIFFKLWYYSYSSEALAARGFWFRLSVLSSKKFLVFIRVGPKLELRVELTMLLSLESPRSPLLKLFLPLILKELDPLVECIFFGLGKLILEKMLLVWLKLFTTEKLYYKNSGKTLEFDGLLHRFCLHQSSFLFFRKSCFFLGQKDIWLVKVAL